MPRRPYVRRTAVKAVPEEPIVEIEVSPPEETEELPEQEAAPEAASVVSDPPSCAMTERKWRGYPVWQCPKCRVDTLDPGLAQVARRACRK